MAILNLSLTIPDNQVPRLQEAVRWQNGPVADGAGGFREMTNQEAIEKLKADLIARLKNLVIECERYKAIRAAEILEPALDVT